MKKRIAFALCMILMVLMLGACGTDPTTVDYNGKSYSDLQSEMDTNAGMVQSLAQLFKENKLTADTLPDDVKDQLTSSYGVTEAQIEAAAKWQDTLDEFGKMKKYNFIYHTCFIDCLWHSVYHTGFFVLCNYANRF